MGYTRAKGLDMQTAKRILPVSLFYNANVAFALASLKGVNIPMYIAIKRLTPLAVLIAGFFSGKGRPTTQVFVAWLINILFLFSSCLKFCCFHTILFLVSSPLATFQKQNQGFKSFFFCLQNLDWFLKNDGRKLQVEVLFIGFILITENQKQNGY